MQEDHHSEYATLIDTVLLAKQKRLLEQMYDLFPSNQPPTQIWIYSAEDLRRSPLGQALLLIATCASGAAVSREQGQRSMQHVYRTLYGDFSSSTFTLPQGFHKKERL